MSGKTAETRRDGALLSAAVRAVRKDRGMTSVQVARAMNIALRTYQRFEAGETRLNLDHIERFARATTSDPHALLLSVMIGSPAFALRCRDNRMATILTIALEKFDTKHGDRLRHLDIRALVAAVTSMFDGLEASMNHGDAEAWLVEGSETISSKRPTPGR